MLKYQKRSLFVLTFWIGLSLLRGFYVYLSQTLTFDVRIERNEIVLVTASIPSSSLLKNQN